MACRGNNLTCRGNNLTCRGNNLACRGNNLTCLGNNLTCRGNNVFRVVQDCSGLVNEKCGFGDETINSLANG